MDSTSNSFANINRNAITIKPKKRCLEWVNKLYPDTSIEATDDFNVYLVHEMDSNNDVEEWLKRNYKIIFQNELHDWHTDREGWPKHLTFEMFREWFDWEINSMIIDLEDDEIIREEF